MSIFSGIGRATRRGFNRMIEARQRQATRYVNGALLNFDDATLKQAGYSRKDLEMRDSASFPF
jgi:hypothetical protein